MTVIITNTTKVKILVIIVAPFIFQIFFLNFGSLIFEISWRSTEQNIELEKKIPWEKSEL